MVASTAVQSVQPSPVDLGALKTRQQGAWSSGDYAVVGTTLQIVGEELCEALDGRRTMADLIDSVYDRAERLRTGRMLNLLESCDFARPA